MIAPRNYAGLRKNVDDLLSLVDEVSDWHPRHTSKDSDSRTQDPYATPWKVEETSYQGEHSRYKFKITKKKTQDYDKRKPEEKYILDIISENHDQIVGTPSQEVLKKIFHEAERKKSMLTHFSSTAA